MSTFEITEVIIKFMKLWNAISWCITKQRQIHGISPIFISNGDGNEVGFMIQFK
jgi:hypothetical protein